MGFRERLTQLEAQFAPGELETVIDRSGIKGCGARGASEVTVRHRPSGREVTVDGMGTQAANKIAALEKLLAELQD